MTHKNIFIFTLFFALFSTLTFADINPINGNWKPNIISYDIKGCPSMMRSVLKKEKLYSTSKNATFSKPFHPNDLFNPKDMNPNGGDDIQWVKTASNEWKTVFHIGQGGMNIDMIWQIKVTSKTTIDMHSKLSMQFPKEMAMMMGGKGECKVDSTGIIKHIGK